MSKMKNKAADDRSSERPTEATSGKRHYAAPEGYVKQAGDIVGFWNYENGPIHATPLYVTLSDSKIDATKSSALIHCRLVDALDVDSPNSSENDEEREQIHAKAGDLVGVWYKPGMVAIKQLGGVKVFMYATGEKKDVKKPSPMIVFEVLSKEKGAPLRIEADRRDKSKQVPGHFDQKPADSNGRAAGVGERRSSQPSDEIPSDDIPF